MVFVHHPFATIGALYLGLVGVVVQIDAGVILVALVPVASIFLTYFLSNRTRRAIRKETQEAATAAAEAAAAAAEAQADVKTKVEEVHVLANSAKAALESQKESLLTALATSEARIDKLEQMLADSHPPRP